MPPRTGSGVDYYRTLGVAPEATAEEIRRAYRRLALQWHPDRNHGSRDAEERFKVISEAYAVLVDPTRRGDYDRARRGGTPWTAPPSRDDLFRDLFADPGASSVFEELAREFERLGMRVDRHYFRHTLFGGRAVVTGGVFVITPLTPVLALFRLARALAGSAGTLASPGQASPGALSPPPRLRDRLARAARWVWGLPAAPSTPPATSAAADVTLPLRLTRTDAERGGARTVPVAVDPGGRPRTVRVTIPAGVRHGTRLRLRGQGRSRGDGGHGDLYLAVEIADPS